MIVYVYLHSNFRSGLRKRMYFEKQYVMAVQGHPSSSILTPIESAYTNSYCSSIVTLVVSCPVLDTLQVFCTLFHPNFWDVALALGLLLHRTRRFFPSSGLNHRQYSLHLPMEGWPGWVGLVGLVKYKVAYPRTVTHLSTNPGERRWTSLIRRTMLALRQTDNKKTKIFHAHLQH